MANRVAFVLDLNGPSFFLDTACSSSLTATHLAIRSIEAGDCDAAVITGCQHNLKCVSRTPPGAKVSRLIVCTAYGTGSFIMNMVSSARGIVSRSTLLLTGETSDTSSPLRTHTPAARFIKGEGAVSIVIKPLEDALASNDNIYAVVGYFARYNFTRGPDPITRCLGLQSTPMGGRPLCWHHLVSCNGDV